MAGKKLLNAYFASTAGTITYSLGCDSSDNVPLTTTWQDSGTHKLNQVGCLFTQPNSNKVDIVKQTALYAELTKNGYGSAETGSRVPYPKSILSIGVKLYLNGAAVVDGVAMPYVVNEYNDYGKPLLTYYTANDVKLGPILNALGSAGQNYCGWAAGQLYDDGTLVGCGGPIKPHELAGLGTYSLTRYEWQCDSIYDTPIQAINSAIIDDLKEYLPSDPEGQFVEHGTGDFDASSDPIDFPNLPSLSVLDTGMAAMYEMSSAQLQALSTYLWTTNFVDVIKKMLNDPMEGILNLCISPVEATAATFTSSIRIGNITTTAEGYKVSSPYKIIDFGSINMKEYWASFADYSPYTKLSIYLPYVGVQQISIDDVMNGTIQLKAYCDVLTGSIQYMLKSFQGNPAGHGHNSVLYTWGGNAQYQIPLTGSNMSAVISSLISMTGTVAGAAGSIAATGGLTAPIAIGTAGSALANVSNAKTHIQRGGGLGGAVGIFGVQTPYLILERPEEVYPQNYENVVGVPNEKTDYLKNYTGFVKVRACNLSISGATDEDINEIESLLKEGVYV